MNFRGNPAILHDAMVVGGTAKKVSRGNTYSNIVTCCDTDTTNHDTLTSRTGVSSGETAYRQPHDVIQTRQLPDVPRIPIDSAGSLRLREK